MKTNRLFVRRVHAEYLVAGDHPDPMQVKTYLDGEIRKNLESSLSTVLSSSFTQNDSSLWFVRSLEVDLAVNASTGITNVTREMTNRVAHALVTTLDPTADQNNVVHFENSSAYLKQFLCDLAAGNAWSCWYYESFEGLRMLPTSAALRTVILDGFDGLEALKQLTSSEFSEVLESLTRHDSRKILDGLAELYPPGDQFHCCELIWEAWQTVDGRILERLENEGRALCLFVRASDSVQTGLNLARAALALLKFRELLTTNVLALELVPLIVDDDPSSLYRVAGNDAETLLALKACSESWLRGVAAQLLSSEQSSKSANESLCNATSFGGAFLLLPLLDELPLETATSQWSDSDDAAAISLVRFLTLIKLGGRERAEGLFYDSTLRALLLIPSSLSLEGLTEWQSRISTTQVHNFLNVLLEWQLNRGTLSRKHLMLIPTGKEIVLVDASRGLWLMVHPWPTLMFDQFVENVQTFVIELEREAGWLISTPEVIELLRSAFPSVRMLRLADAEREAEAPNELKHAMSLTRNVQNDVSYLSLSPSLSGSETLDRALSIVSQHVLRSFAWRLPGFSESNLKYLSENFLDFRASVYDEPSRRVVRIGGPPLQLVLSITGMTRQSYHLSWLDDRPFTLFPEN